MTEPIKKGEYVRIAAVRHAVLQFLRFSKQAATSVGITPQEHQLLLAVVGHPERDWATISEIAHHLQVRHNTAVNLVNRAVSSDLVRKRAHVSDGRTIRVELTAKGQELLEDLTQVHRHELQHLAGTLATQISSLTSHDAYQ